MTKLEEVLTKVRGRAIASTGEMYIRKLRGEPEADMRKWLYSRNPVFELWKGIPGQLEILTLPGLEWKLEKKLLAYRHPRRLKTQFSAAERDSAIYHLSQKSMPPLVDRFENVNVEELITSTDRNWTAAWLDFNGPLTATKVGAIVRLWPRLSYSLVLTFMGARFDGEVKAMLKRSGGWSELVADALKIPRSQVGAGMYEQGGSMKFWQVTAMKSGKLPPMSPCRYINGIKVEELIGAWKQAVKGP